MSHTDANLQVAERFYAALAATDTRTLVELLDPQFQGEMTAGLPEGWGGTYHGVRDMLECCWRPVYARLGSRPVPDEYLPSGPDRLVVLGRYQGRAHTTGRPFEAAFAHVLRFADGRICELIQVTDSARWHEALQTTTAR